MTLPHGSPFTAEREAHTPNPGVWVSLTGLDQDSPPGSSRMVEVRKLITMTEAARLAQHLLGIVLDEFEYGS